MEATRKTIGIALALTCCLVGTLKAQDIYGVNYTLLESTNMALSLTQWTPVLTNTFTSNGSLNLSTNIVNRANPAEYYILEVP